MLIASRLFLILIALHAGGASAQDASPAVVSTGSAVAPTGEFKRFMADARYEFRLHGDLKHSGVTENANPSNLTGGLTGMRAFGSLNYRPSPGVMVSVHLGSAFLNTLVLSANSPVQGPITQTTPFDNAVVYGLGAKIDFFPGIRFHMGPAFRYIRTEFASSRTTLANPTCGSYDFATNNTTTCPTVGMYNAGGVVAARFSQNDFTARFEMSVDIAGEINAPLVGLAVGVEENITILNGGYAYTPPLSTSPSYEAYTFTSQRTEGFYVQLTGNIGPVRLFAEGRGIAVTEFSGGVGVNF